MRFFKAFSTKFQTVFAAMWKHAVSLVENSFAAFSALHLCNDLYNIVVQLVVYADLVFYGFYIGVDR